MHFSHHVLDSWLEVAEEGFGLVSLHLAVLDGLSSQEVVHLDSEDGRRAALILTAGIACAGERTGVFYFPPVDAHLLPDPQSTWERSTGRSRPLKTLVGHADHIRPGFYDLEARGIDGKHRLQCLVCFKANNTFFNNLS